MPVALARPVVERLAGPDSELHVIEGARHEVFNETDKRQRSTSWRASRSVSARAERGTDVLGQGSSKSPPHWTWPRSASCIWLRENGFGPWADGPASSAPTAKAVRQATPKHGGKRPWSGHAPASRLRALASRPPARAVSRAQRQTSASRSGGALDARTVRTRAVPAAGRWRPSRSSTPGRVRCFAADPGVAAGPAGSRARASYRRSKSDTAHRSR